MNNKKTDQELIIFETMDLEKPLDVIYMDDTLWLNQQQMEILFSTDRSSIVRHINNIYKTAELNSKSTCAKIAQVRFEGQRKIVRHIMHYNLDMIISVGYRVNSKRGTQFRIWATKVLKDHLLNGYSLNEKRLAVVSKSMSELKNSIVLIERAMRNAAISNQEMHNLVRVISDYSEDLALLDSYDNQTIVRPQSEINEKSPLSYEEVIQVVNQLKSMHKEKLFGLAKDNSLDSSINTIYQTYDGKELYPSLLEKAANLLYFITKNHPFIDGNKRIAASIFLYFLNKNQILYNADGRKILSDGVLAAITLLVAESKPEEKETLISIIMHYLKPVKS